jgi:hypothetical protein
MMSAATRGVPLFVRHHEAGAHRVILRVLTAVPAALADTDTAQGGMRKAAVIFGELEMRHRFPGTIVRAQSQVLIDPVRLDELAGIHLPIRVPDRLELTESLDQLRPEHLLKELATRLSVTMLAA